MNKEIIDSLLERAEEMLKGDNSREISTEEIITILKEYKQLQQELKDGINARFEMQRRIDKLQKENETLKEEIKDLIEENHKHIDYIADMKKKHEDKIRNKIKELEGTISFGLTIEVLNELIGETKDEE